MRSPPIPRPVRRQIVALACGVCLALLATGVRANAAAPTFASQSFLSANAGSDTAADFEVRVESDGAGNWVAVWQTRNVGLDADILVSRSSDDGATWTGPELLHATLGADAGDDERPEVTTDGAGNWVVVWQSDEPVAAGDRDFDLFVSRSTDGGASWSAPAPLADDAATDDRMDGAPDLAADGAGNWLAIWQSSDPTSPGLDFDIRVARSTDGGTTWSTTALLDPAAVTDTLDDTNPRIATDRAGTWIASWNSDEPGSAREVVVSRSTDAGVTWSTPMLLNPDARNDNDAQIVATSDGSWVAVWESSDLPFGSDDVLGGDFDIFFSRSTDAGVSWSPPSDLNRNAPVDRGMDFDPQIAADGLGTLIATWQSNDPFDATGNDFDLMFATSPDHGASWTPPSPLHPELRTDMAGEFDPQVVSGLGGRWTVVSYGTDVAGGDLDIRISRGGTPFSPPEWLDATSGSDTSHDTEPSLATDGAGNWVAVWSTNDPAFGGTDLDLVVTRSSDGGASWTGPMALSSTSQTDDVNENSPQVVSDGAGRWVAVWHSAFGLGSDLDILTARSDDAGATWTPPTPLNDRALKDGAEDFEARLATDGAGTWVAVWTSGEPAGRAGLDLDILYARSTDGGESWSKAVPLNSHAVGDTAIDVQPDVATDGVDWVATWASNLDGDLDVMVSHSSDAGLTWSEAAPIVADAAGHTDTEYLPRIATGGTGSWLTVWQSTDAEGGLGYDFDVLFARSLDGGATWSPPAALDQDASVDVASDSAPCIVPDHAGNWVALWETREGAGPIELSMARSSDDGLTWSPRARLGEGVAGSHWSPRLDSDEAGGWVALWIAKDPGGVPERADPDLLFARGAGPDADFDGLADAAEVNRELTNPASPDTDLDGLTDGQEVLVLGSDPLATDSDGDSLDDLAEVYVYGTDATNGDSDGDSLTDDQEILVHGTNPLDVDSDGDSLTDDEEILVYGTNPLDVDSDGDQLADDQEIAVHGTDPTNADSDGDGFMDGTELAAGFDPIDPLSPPPSTPVPGPPGLVGYWSFDEGAGVLLGDETGNTDGIVFGASWSPGRPGSALGFDGVDDHVVLANTSALDIQGDAITLAAWIQPEDGGAEFGSRVISKRWDEGTSDAYSMYTFENRLVFRIDDVDFQSEQTFLPGVWLHVVMVYDGIDKRIYLDGVLDPATPQPKSGAVASSSRAVHLGMRENEGRYFDGRMDEVRIYDRALTAEEVLALYLEDAPVVPMLPPLGVYALLAVLYGVGATWLRGRAAARGARGG